MTKIDETLRKIAADISRANSPTSSSIEPAPSALPGDPHCPICHGIGFLRQDLPISHPNFGKLQICACRQKETADAVHQRLYRLSNLDAFRDKTFESFTVQGRLGLGDDHVKSLKLALSQATQFSRELKGWLLLMGSYGTGKTHLAAAIANFAVDVGVPTLFLTVPDLLDWLRFAYDSPESTFEQRFDEIRNINLLVLDDLGTQNTTPWAQEKLFQIINHRYVNQLATIITSNQQLAEIDGRIRSRLIDPDLVTLVQITAPDYRSPKSDTSQPVLSTLQHHANQTLGNFNLREVEKLTPEEQQSLRKAHNAACEYAEQSKGWLVLMGKTFTGKTHLAAAIGNYHNDLGKSPMFVVVPDLLDHLRATFGPTSAITYDKLFNQVCTASLLILDDLGTQSATPWAKEKLFQIFNYRYNAELPTVITTSLTLEEIDPRIQSRMLDTRLCSLYAIMAPPFRGGAAATAAAKARRAKRSA
jgi:DNA replication protein DnaC